MCGIMTLGNDFPLDKAQHNHQKHVGLYSQLRGANEHHTTRTEQRDERTAQKP